MQLRRELAGCRAPRRNHPLVRLPRRTPGGGSALPLFP